MLGWFNSYFELGVFSNSFPLDESMIRAMLYMSVFLIFSGILLEVEW